MKRRTQPAGGDLSYGVKRKSRPPMRDSTKDPFPATEKPPVDPRSPGDTTYCALCGLPAGRSKIRLNLNGTSHPFCCPGCLNVFQILTNSPDGPPLDFKETELYRTCLALGIIANPGGEIPENREALAAPICDAHEPAETDSAKLCQDLTLTIKGMWCTACSWVIDRALRKSRGVVEVEVSFLADLLRVKYLPHLTNPLDIQGKIDRLGYRTVPFSMESDGSAEDGRLFLRLGVSSILTANIMMISFALYFGLFQDLGTDALMTLSVPLLVLATPVLFYGGLPIIRRGVSGIRHGAMSMDTLIAVGSLSAYVYSIAQMRSATAHLYFDTAAMLVTVALLGKFIETRAKESVSRGILDLVRLYNGKVRLVNRGREAWVASGAVEVGMHFVVRSQERSPLDGLVVSGRGNVDESVLTGEPRPVGKSAGDRVLAGSLLLDGELEIRALKTAEESSIGRLIDMIRNVLAGRSPSEILADRITRWFVPAILVLALSLFWVLSLTGASSQEALMRALTVLVITCPCALGIATPLAKIASITAGKTKGILIRDHHAFEQARNLDTVVFDKTGTLTEGTFSLTEIVTAGIPEEEALRKVASIEADSDHFLALEIRRAAESRELPLETVLSPESLEGMGVRGVLQDGEVAAGNRALMGSLGLHVPPGLEASARAFQNIGGTTVFFAWAGEVRGLMGFGDVLKESGREAVAALQARGLSVWLASGDSRATTDAVAKELGISQCLGDALPHEKMDLVERLQSEGHLVGFAGDGINDAPALARADVGFAFGTAAHAFHDVGHVGLMGNDPRKVITTIRFSARVSRTIRQNLFFALIYNALAIPLAVMGVLNPLIAVVAMFLSSLTVIGNTLRFTKRESAP